MLKYVLIEKNVQKKQIIYWQLIITIIISQNVKSVNLKKELKYPIYLQLEPYYLMNAWLSADYRTDDDSFIDFLAINYGVGEQHWN